MLLLIKKEKTKKESKQTVSLKRGIRKPCQANTFTHAHAFLTLFSHFPLNNSYNDAVVVRGALKLGGNVSRIFE